VFDAHLARWEAAEADPDGTVERVARAIWEAEDAHSGSGFPCGCGWIAGFGEGWEDRLERHRSRAVAAAAIDAMRPAPDAPRVDDDGCDWNQGYAAAMADMQLEALETGR
jgi:hypothetical protein